MRNWLQDTFNGLHVRCRLMDCGVSRVWAKRLAGWWEAITRAMLYGGIMDSKAWWMSRGVWGGIVAVAAGLIGIFGYTVSAEDQAHLVELLLAIASGVGGIVAIIGRARGEKKISFTGRSLVSLLLVTMLSVSLAGCGGASGSGPGITAEQAKAGAAYLESSVATLQKALDQAKATGDPAKVATAQAVLDQATTAAAAFKATLPEASQDQWDVARSLVTTAVSVLGPMAVQALVAR